MASTTQCRHDEYPIDLNSFIPEIAPKMLVELPIPHFGSIRVAPRARFKLLPFFQVSFNLAIKSPENIALTEHVISVIGIPLST